MACFGRLHGEVKAGCRQRKWQDLEYMPLLGSTGGAAWGSQAKSGLFSSKLEITVFW